jgi:hypothetical protein
LLLHSFSFFSFWGWEWFVGLLSNREGVGVFRLPISLGVHWFCTRQFVVRLLVPRSLMTEDHCFLTVRVLFQFQLCYSWLGYLNSSTGKPSCVGVGVYSPLCLPCGGSCFGSRLSLSGGKFGPRPLGWVLQWLVCYFWVVFGFMRHFWGRGGGHHLWFIGVDIVLYYNILMVMSVFVTSICCV